MNLSTTIFDLLVNSLEIDPHVGDSEVWDVTSLHFVGGNVIIASNIFIA